ncbi:MAG: FtsQ-type POTRA domain-containing protein [Chthoniobacterales bacterium]
MSAKRSNSSPRPRNQRLSTSRQRRQQHLLDVRVRSRRASHHRNRRILVFLSKIVLIVGLCAGAYFGTRVALNRFFFANPDYRLSSVSVSTDGTLTRQAVLEKAGIQEGTNIFSINLAQVHNRLQQLTQVDEVQVERKMPNEIDIHITERRPVAWITSENELKNPFRNGTDFLVDARGVILKEKNLVTDYLSLPVITNCSSEALVPGKQVDSFEAKTALALLRLTTTSFMQTRFQIQMIDVSKGYCLLVTDKNQTQVMFGFDDLEKQMEKLEQLLVYSDDSHRQISTANLLVARNIPVTFAQPVSEIISQLEENGEVPEAAPAEKKLTPEPKRETAAGKPHKSAPKIWHEPEVRAAKPVQHTIRRATLVSPGVKQYRSRPTAPLPASSPARKGVPIQHFKMENDGHNG